MASSAAASITARPKPMGLAANHAINRAIRVPTAVRQSAAIAPIVAENPIATPGPIAAIARIAVSLAITTSVRVPPRRAPPPQRRSPALRISSNAMARAHRTAGHSGRPSESIAPPDAAPSQRIDRFLWFARLTGNRSAAQALAERGIVRLNGRRVERAHTPVRRGDLLTLPLGNAVRVIRIVELPGRRGPAPEARTHYELIEQGDGNAGFSA